VSEQQDTCLYCEAIPRSEEHPLPAALGEFVDAPLLKDRICANCNSKRLGLLDEQFTRCGAEAVVRTQLGVDGRAHHEKASPYYRGSAGGGRIEARSWDENLQCYVNLEFTGGNQARQITELILMDETGHDHHIALRKTTTPEQLRNQYRKLKLTQVPTSARMTYDPPTEAWARDLVEAAFPEVSFSELTTGSSMFKGSLIKLTLTDRYFREVAKIGFHYFLTQFPSLSGGEPEFAAIRDFIINDTNAAPTPTINRFVKQRTHSVIFPPHRKGGWLGHALVAEIKQGECLAHFEPFIFGASGLPARTVFIGRLPIDGSRRSGHLHLFYPEGKQGKFSGKTFLLTPGWLQIETGSLFDVIPPQAQPPEQLTNG
jgi:hypothetical protein